MLRHLTALVALSALCLGVVAVPTPPAFAYEPHVLRYTDGLDVSSLNPFFASSGNAVALNELTGAEFTRIDAKGNSIPELITVIRTGRQSRSVCAAA